MSDSGNSKIKGKLKNDDKELQLVFDDDLKRSLMQSDNAQTNDNGDPTKFTLLNDALVASVNDKRKKHFSQFLDYDEVLQMNDIRDHARLLPLVFGNSSGLDKTYYDRRLEKIKEIQKLFNDHCDEHIDNMFSYKAGARLSLVHALRNDNSVTQTDKEVKKMFSGGR